MNTPSKERQPAVAGQFYPGTPDALESAIEDYLCPPSAPPSGRVRALIEPHAGYQYSGRTAGAGYALLLKERKAVRRAVVLAPTHRVPFRGVSTGGFTAFNTPLGKLPVDVDACRDLIADNSMVSDRADAHLYEHALEVQLPFLQTVLAEDFMLVPVVCGQMSMDDTRAVAQTIARHLWTDDTLWIISSDFTHYGSSFGYVPFTKDVRARLQELDTGAIREIERHDLEGFMNYVERTGATICGATPIGILLGVLESQTEDYKVRKLAYTNSGILTGDFSHSVSYASIGVFDTRLPRHHAVQGTAEGRLGISNSGEKLCLQLAREAIQSQLEKGDIGVPPEDELPSFLRDPGACFVTLHIGDNLRGCIGSLEPAEPLYLDIVRNARNAAFRDPRFRPLTEDEFRQIHIEISILTPAQRIESPEQFEIGRHGIILEKGPYRAVFLPQVAPEQGWDRDTTLTHLALKAGLGPDDWKRNTQFSVFEAIVFGEE
ncbi:MAG: AmmeMemoRadiSam system protein B [Candidatus Pacebacteria bacterium]|nr:AmmeMemoRadiSam system protein B [Candidatus Paceibacterota bacterium]